MKLRPAQKQILKYKGGRLAINAVPGSGKTFTLALLAAQIIKDGLIDLESGQTVLVVTYLNASVDAFRAAINRRLNDLNLPETGFEVRTLHSLSLEIVREVEGSTLDIEDNFVIADEFLSREALAQAIDNFEITLREHYASLSNTGSALSRRQWLNLLETMATEFIRTAKNYRCDSEAILKSVENLRSQQYIDFGTAEVGVLPSLSEMAAIYGGYQTALDRIKALDFDDIIWRAVDLLETRPDAVDAFRSRWPFVLEDEAQDSVPLQEQLLSILTGHEGNWVRAGDPNQSITSSFTSADPRHFNNYTIRPDVKSLPLPNSGRSAARIYQLANELIHWVSDEHPIKEVRQQTFISQKITATPQGDSQPNPPDSEARVKIKVFKNRNENELPGVASAAVKLAGEKPGFTIAILTPTNYLGQMIGNCLKQLGAEYDDLLRGGGLVRQVAGTLQAFISLLAEPQQTKYLEAAFSSLGEVGHPVIANAQNPRKISALLRSVVKPEQFLYPQEAEHWDSALPVHVATEDDMRILGRYAGFLRRVIELRSLPVEDLVLSLSDMIFGDTLTKAESKYDQELATAFQIANEMRLRLEVSTGWRLTDLAIELENLALGRRLLQGASQRGYLFKPKPGRITLVTQHSAKGMEWDAVFLVGIDANWIPGDLDSQFHGEVEAIGGNPTADIKSNLLQVIQQDHGLYPGRTATESANIELISERLRLLYVGITRARRILHISRSEYIQQRNRDKLTKPATVMKPLFEFNQQYTARQK